jgi:hypothetical protein
MVPSSSSNRSEPSALYFLPILSIILIPFPDCFGRKVSLDSVGVSDRFKSAVSSSLATGAPASVSQQNVATVQTKLNKLSCSSPG